MSGPRPGGAGSAPDLDEHGHLRNPSQWTPEFARSMARADGIELTDAHWEVIEVLRSYYGEYDIDPPMRALLRILRERLGQPELDSRALYRLFPEGPAKQGSRYAGLPKPASCI